jgi:hypothetical protein
MIGLASGIQTFIARRQVDGLGVSGNNRSLSRS